MRKPYWFILPTIVVLVIILVITTYQPATYTVDIPDYKGWYSVKNIEGMPCIIIRRYLTNAITCDWVKWEGKPE